MQRHGADRYSLHDYCDKNNELLRNIVLDTDERDFLHQISLISFSCTGLFEMVNVLKIPLH